jgi:hypothetical protein
MSKTGLLDSRVELRLVENKKAILSWQKPGCLSVRTVGVREHLEAMQFKG